MKTAMSHLWLIIVTMVGVLSGWSQTNLKLATEKSARVEPAEKQAMSRSAVDAAGGRPDEQIRTACIRGRRLVCGKVIEISPEGLVVESGYTNLLRAPLTQSWVAPANVSASRNPKTVELSDPGSVCVGLIFLTDIPKTPRVKQYDYVMIQAYPAGQYSYTSVPTVTKTIRKFSAGLETAVRLSGPANAGKKRTPLAQP
jgi:hypothetical protein